MHEHAARCLVDVLGHAHQPGAGLPDRHGDLDIVEAVAGQPVELVDEDVVDAVLLQVLQQVLQAIPVGGACRLALVDEVASDPCPES